MSRNLRVGVSRLGLSPRPLSKQIVLDAARKIILSEGHEALTLRRLGRDLGVTAPAMYGYFESKEDLLRAVAQREFETFVREYDQIAADDPIEILRAMSRHYVAYARENAELFRFLTSLPPGFFRREFFDPSGEVDAFGARVFRPRAVAVTEAMASGRLVSDDPFLVNLAVFTAVHGVAAFLLWDPDFDPEFEQRLVDLVIDAVLRGLAPPDPMQSTTPEE
jgi:AcrR family transcriptional regulator